MDWRDRLGQSQSLQHFNREADEADAWMVEKLQTAGDESYKDPTNLQVCGQPYHYLSCVVCGYCVFGCGTQGKLQKHEAFEAEVLANKERIFGIISAGEGVCVCVCVCVFTSITSFTTTQI